MGAIGVVSEWSPKDPSSHVDQEFEVPTDVACAIDPSPQRTAQLSMGRLDDRLCVWVPDVVAHTDLTMYTSQGAWAATPEATLPSTRLMPWTRRLPTTMKLAPTRSA